MMFWFTVRPAIKEFIQRVKDFPEQFRLGNYYIECRETGAYLDFEFDGCIDEIRTSSGRLYRRHLSFMERRTLKRLGKYVRKINSKGEMERERRQVSASLNSMNPEKLVKEND